MQIRHATPVLAAALALALAAFAAVAEPQPAGGSGGSTPASQPDQSPASDGKGAGKGGDDAGRWWELQVQATDVFQYKPPMRSPFSGVNSLPGPATASNTLDASVILGLRPWQGGEIWYDEDMNQGFAPGNTLGAAGFVNGEGAKVGHHSPYYRPQRYFLRQTFELGGGGDKVDPDMLAFGGPTTRDRIVVTVGKFSLTDLMDDNAYAHDPKNDFLNWALIDTGSWDYAADAWGFSEGAAAEWYQGDWTLRGAVMDMSTLPNTAELTPAFGQFQLDGELEYRQRWLFGQTGKIKLLGFVSRAQMGRYDDAVALADATGSTPNTALVRRYRSRPGVTLNIEQPLSDTAGLFVRAGWADGAYESYEYTDIDRTFAAGASLKGDHWGRKDDTAALALVVNGISREHELYLAGGGLGILVGDGRLPHPGAETILEAYYSLGVVRGLHVTLDTQTVVNPAYDRDRGPAEVIGLRLHGQY
ncbi:MAG TPA: carbohydrate porin [Caulobacteraceae bacterium]|jgi:high affinity Mn2+ porin